MFYNSAKNRLEGFVSMRHFTRCLAGAVCAVLLLSSCGAPGAASTTPGPSLSLSPPRIVTDAPAEERSERARDVAGEEGRGMVKGDFTADGLEGRYYNDYLRSTLSLDGAGSFRLTESGRVKTGHYVYSGGALMLESDGERLSAAVDSGGDVTIDGRRGYYFDDFAFWGITAAEAGPEQTEDFPVGLIDNGDGTYRYRDTDDGVAVTFPSGMTVLSNALPMAVTVSDGQGSFVTGRNVTKLYSTTLGDNQEFLTDYLRSFIMGESGDYAKLYTETERYESLHLISGGGSLAAAELWINGVQGRTLVRMVLYTSTYPDGTVNQICKTIFAPSEERAEALEAAVTEMGAVRLVT